MQAMVKCLAGGIMIFFAFSLLYASTTQPIGGAALFGGQQIKIKPAKRGLKNLLASYRIRKRRQTKPTPKENLAPPAGLEPATYGLTVRRSTD